MLQRATTTLVMSLLVSMGCWSTEEPGGSPDGGGGVETLPCEALQRAACRARLDCVEDSCFFCSCTPVFRSCRGVGEIADDCPDLDCALPECCARNSECTVQGHLCRPPDAPSICSVCVGGPGDCYVDTDCEVGEICEPIPCHCGDARACVPGCMEASGCGGPPGPGCNPRGVGCPDGLFCSHSDHPRCIGPECHADADCEPDFDCNFGDCERRPCAEDSDCAVVCVKGRCHASLGICGPL